MTFLFKQKKFIHCALRIKTLVLIKPKKEREKEKKKNALLFLCGFLSQSYKMSERGMYHCTQSVIENLYASSTLTLPPVHKSK